MAEYIKEDINYNKPEMNAVIHKDYGEKLRPCPVCGLDGVIYEVAGIGFVGCPLSISIAFSRFRHPNIGYSDRAGRRKSEAVKLWNERM